MPFEVLFWADRHPHVPEKSIVGAGPSTFPTPFHPIGFGNEAVRALFGFIVEGPRSPDDVDRWTVRLHDFRVTDPDAPSLTERQAWPWRVAATLTSWRMELAPDGRTVMVPADSISGDHQQA